MTEKTKAKHAQIKQADLNYITSKSLDEVVNEMVNIRRFDFDVHVIYSDEDTALFQMQYTRDKRITAEVVGRLQSWAGDMTHVYSYDHSFHAKTHYNSRLFRLVLFIFFLSPCIIWLLSTITTGTVRPQNSVVTMFITTISKFEP